VAQGTGLKSRSKFEVTFLLTVSQSVCLGIEHPSGTLRPDVTSCRSVAVFFLWGTLSDERTGLQFTV
jgi:hypothetical protein